MTITDFSCKRGYRLINTLMLEWIIWQNLSSYKERMLTVNNITEDKKIKEN